MTGNRTTINPSKPRTLKTSPRAQTVYLRITYDCHSKPSCPSFYSIPRLVFIMEAQCVLCKVPTNPLQIVQTLNRIRTPPHTTTNVSNGILYNTTAHSAVATDLGHPYWIYIFPTHDMHQWLLLQFLVLLMMDAESLRNM